MSTEDLKYGPGGYDPELPHGNLIESLVNNGDGTGVHTDYTTDPPTVTNLTGLEPPFQPEPTPEERIAALEADLAAALALLEGA